MWHAQHNGTYAFRPQGTTLAKVVCEPDGWHWATYDGMWTHKFGVEMSYEAATAAAEAELNAMRRAH